MNRVSRQANVSNLFSNELSKWIKPWDKLGYRICFQNWSKWIKPQDKVKVLNLFSNYLSKWIEPWDKPGYQIYFQNWTFEMSRASG